MANQDDIEGVKSIVTDAVRAVDPAAHPDPTPALEAHINEGLLRQGLSLISLAGLGVSALLEGQLVRVLTTVVLTQLGLEGDPEGGGKSKGGV